MKTLVATGYAFALMPLLLRSLVRLGWLKEYHGRIYRDGKLHHLVSGYYIVVCPPVVDRIGRRLPIGAVDVDLIATHPVIRERVDDAISSQGPFVAFFGMLELRYRAWRNEIRPEWVPVWTEAP